MASFNIFRIFRFLRSIFVPTAAVIAFSSLLTFIFVLYQPTPGPGSIQRLGWQSWDVIMEPSGNSEDVSLDVSNGAPSASNDQDSGVDWWNVTEVNTGAADLSSLPLDVWDPLMPHDTGCRSSHIIPRLWLFGLREQLRISMPPQSLAFGMFCGFVLTVYDVGCIAPLPVLRPSLHSYVRFCENTNLLLLFQCQKSTSQIA